MPDFLPIIELGAKTIRSASRMRLCRGTLAYIGAAIDCGLPMRMRISQSSPAASAAAETSPEAVSARTESAAPASGYPRRVTTIGQRTSDRIGLWLLSGAASNWAGSVRLPIAFYGWHDECWCWTSDGETWHPSHAQSGHLLPAPSDEFWIQVSGWPFDTSAGPPAAGDDPAGTPPPAGSPQTTTAAAECPAPEFDWVTTAIPVITGVLAEHMAEQRYGPVLCHGSVGIIHAEFTDWQGWRDHVAPHIAIDIQTTCVTRTYDFPSGDRPRPLADSPRYQNPRK